MVRARMLPWLAGGARLLRLSRRRNSRRRRCTSQRTSWHTATPVTAVARLGAATTPGKRQRVTITDSNDVMVLLCVRNSFGSGAAAGRTRTKRLDSYGLVQHGGRRSEQWSWFGVYAHAPFRVPAAPATRARTYFHAEARVGRAAAPPARSTPGEVLCQRNTRTSAARRLGCCRGACARECRRDTSHVRHHFRSARTAGLTALAHCMAAACDVRPVALRCASRRLSSALSAGACVRGEGQTGVTLLCIPAAAPIASHARTPAARAPPTSGTMSRQAVLASSS